jgi:NhaP-type Na+/H+ or K+/H+ antiporter
MVIGACLTPTDPVLANSIMKGKFAEAHIPLNVRLVLSAESGINDGLGTPFLFLAIYLMRIVSDNNTVEHPRQSIWHIK